MSQIVQVLLGNNRGNCPIANRSGDLLENFLAHIPGSKNTGNRRLAIIVSQDVTLCIKVKDVSEKMCFRCHSNSNEHTDDIQVLG